MAATMALTAMLYVRTPKGYFPRDDRGLIWGSIYFRSGDSFEAVSDLQQKAEAVVRADPAVASVGSYVPGNLYISLKPLAERGSLSAQAVATRLRQKTADGPGLWGFFSPMQDVRAGGRPSDSTYRFTLWDADYNELRPWAPRVLAEVQSVPGLVDVSADLCDG